MESKELAVDLKETRTGVKQKGYLRQVFSRRDLYRFSIPMKITTVMILLLTGDEVSSLFKFDEVNLMK